MNKKQIELMIRKYYELSIEELNLNMHLENYNKNDIKSMLEKDVIIGEIKSLSDRMDRLEKEIKINNNNILPKMFDFIEGSW